MRTHKIAPRVEYTDAAFEPPRPRAWQAAMVHRPPHGRIGQRSCLGLDRAAAVALVFTIYAGWVAITWWWCELPAPLLVILGGWLLAWHGSLQHETIHHHPTRLRWLNDAIGFPPLALWLPYELYRRSHLRHHRDNHLTDPIEDPESAYLTAGAWLQFGRIGRALHRARLTLSGRMVLCPVLMVVEFWQNELGHLAIGD